MCDGTDRRASLSFEAPNSPPGFRSTLKLACCLQGDASSRPLAVIHITCWGLVPVCLPRPRYSTKALSPANQTELKVIFRFTFCADGSMKKTTLRTRSRLRRPLPRESSVPHSPGILKNSPIVRQGIDSRGLALLLVVLGYLMCHEQQRARRTTPFFWCDRPEYNDAYGMPSDGRSVKRLQVLCRCVVLSLDQSTKERFPFRESTGYWWCGLYRRNGGRLAC